MARFIEVPAQNDRAIVNVDNIDFITPASGAMCNVHFSKDAVLVVDVSMHEFVGRMQDAKQFGKI